MTKFERMGAATVLFVGNTVRDLVFQMDHLPADARKYRARALLETGGGMAANAAVAAARLGADCRLISRVGWDDADRLIAELERYGVDCASVERHQGRFSTLSAIFVDGEGERMIVTCSDQTMPARSTQLPERLPAGVGAILGDIRWDEAVEHYFALGRAAGIPVVLDADRAPASPRLEALASHIVYSAQAAFELTGLSSPAAALAALRERGQGWQAVTDGARGTWFTAEGEIGHAPAPVVRAIDSLGAGDVYHGAFTLALAERRSTPEAIDFASAAAAAKCAAGSGRDSFPRRQDVLDLLGRGAQTNPT